MNELIQNYCDTDENKIDFYLNCLDILVDSDPEKINRCEYKMDVKNEPIVPLDEEGYCKKCMMAMMLCEAESFCVCIQCGLVKPVLIFKQNYNDRTFEFSGYAYQRITHFRKHWRMLANKIGQKRIDKHQEVAELMFRKIESLFRKFKPKDRKNFFNYRYILIKMFEMFKRPDIRKHLTHLKSKEKLKAHDDIWEQICEEQNWIFRPSHRLVEHKRIYKKKLRRKKKKRPRNKKRS
jgi:hypothetical protein